MHIIAQLGHKLTLKELPAQLFQGKEGFHMCDIWASVQGPLAVTGTRVEPHSGQKQLQLHIYIYNIYSIPDYTCQQCID